LEGLANVNISELLSRIESVRIRSDTLSNLVRAKLHQLIDRLDDDILGPALHAAIDTLPDEVVPQVLRRMLQRTWTERSATIRNLHSPTPTLPKPPRPAPWPRPAPGRPRPPR
jgi:hypothetical protein